MVRTGRLELPHLSAPEPKSGVSTNFTTSAQQHQEWGGRWGLNPRPPESQSGALPTELRPPLHLTFYSLPDQQHATGTPGRNRTRNLRLRRPLLYPIELRAHCYPPLNRAVASVSQAASPKEVRILRRDFFDVNSKIQLYSAKSNWLENSHDLNVSARQRPTRSRRHGPCDITWQRPGIPAYYQLKQ